MKITSLFLILISATGCATTAKYKARLDKWIGRDIAAFIDVKGSPTKIVDLPNSSKIYVWIEGAGGGQSFTTNTPVSTPYSRSRGYNYNYATTHQIPPSWCKTDITTNPQGIILKWRIEGNACRTK